MPRPEGSGALAGKAVLITRPAHQGAGLAQAVRAAGGEALCAPVIEIEALAPGAAVEALAAALGGDDLVLFTSANAVTHGAWLARRGAARIGAVGAATARALAGAGLEVALVPERDYRSEGLLALEALAPARLAGRTVLLVKGSGGRELLARELAARGARVVTAEVYRRVRPGPEGEQRLRAALARTDIAVVTSVEGLENLVAMAGAEGHRRLAGLDLVVASERVAARARALGVGRAVRVAAQVSDSALLAALRASADSARGIQSLHSPARRGRSR